MVSDLEESRKSTAREVDGVTPIWRSFVRPSTTTFRYTRVSYAWLDRSGLDPYNPLVVNGPPSSISSPPISLILLLPPSILELTCSTPNSSSAMACLVRRCVSTVASNNFRGLEPYQSKTSRKEMDRGCSFASFAHNGSYSSISF